MRASECGRILLDGVKKWNSWKAGLNTKTGIKIRPILKGLDISGIDMQGADLSNTIIIECSMKGTNLFNSTFENSRIIKCNISGAEAPMMNMKSAIVLGTCMDELIAPGISLDNSTLVGVKLRCSYIPRSSFQYTTLIDVKADNAMLTGSDMSNSAIILGSYINTIFSEVTMRGATILSAGLTAADMTAIKASYSCMLDITSHGADMTDGDLSDSEIIRMNGIGMRLDGACMEGSHVLACDFSGGSFSVANVTDADLSCSNISGARTTAAVGLDTAVTDDTIDETEPDVHLGKE